MFQLSELMKKEKNKISSTGVWLVLLDIVYENAVVFNLVLNNENITYNNVEYLAFPFEVGENKQTSDKELITLDIKVCNIDRTVESYLEQYNGGKNTTVIFRVINAEYPNEPPVMEETFTVLSTKADAQWVTFQVGCDFSFYQRFPKYRYRKDVCNFRYKDIQCACTSTLATCNGTLKNCRERGNSSRFGGFSGISNANIYQ